MTYKFRDAPLTPESVAIYIRATKAKGDVIKRSEIAREIERFHVENGGIISGETITRVKQAFKALLIAGDIEFIQKGYYRLLRTFGAKIFDNNNAIVIEREIEEIPSIPVFGNENDGGIYVMFDASHKEEAEKIGKHIFQCKVGKASSIHHAKRRNVDYATFSGEKPVFGCYLSHGNHHDLEAYVHNALFRAARALRARNGAKELFETSPEEISDWFFRFIQSGDASESLG